MTFTNDIILHAYPTQSICGGTAEKYKIQIGAAEDLETPEDMSVQGRDLLTGKPKQVEVSYREIAKVRQIKELKMLLWKLYLKLQN
jgi:rod shape-determining protein MreB